MTALICLCINACTATINLILYWRTGSEMFLLWGLLGVFGAWVSYMTIGGTNER